MNKKMRMDSEQCPIALVDDGNVVTLMQVPVDDNWVQMLQLELERLQKSRMKIGNHVSQLLMLCTQESHTFQDYESCTAVQALLTGYATAPGEEHLVDAVDGWVKLWAARILELLRLPSEVLVCLGSQEAQEHREMRARLQKQMVRGRKLLVAAR